MFVRLFTRSGRRSVPLRSHRRAAPVHARLLIEPLESRQLLTTFYIADPQFGGNDANTGTDTQDPWATIAQVNAAVAGGMINPGDTICFHRGDTFAGNLVFGGVGGTAGNPITIRDYGTDPNAPAINAGDGTGILIQDAGNFEIANLQVAGSYDPISHQSSYGNGIEFLSTTANTLSNIYIHDVTVHGFGNGGETFIHAQIGVGILIYVQSPPDTGMVYQGITISRCNVFNTVRAGVEMLDARYASLLPFPATIANVEIDHVDAHEIVPPVGIGDIHGGNGILLIGVDGGVVQRCRAFDNGTRLSLDSGVAIWTHHSNHILFQYNEAYDNFSLQEADGGGFDFDSWVTNSIMQYNYSHDNDAYGYMLGSLTIPVPMVENNIIRFNISENDCRNSRYGSLLFEDWAASNVEVYNNTFYMSDNGLAEPADGTYYVAPAIRFDAGDPNNPPQAAPSIHVYNNIFVTTSISSAVSVPVVIVERYFPVAHVTFQGNDYFSNGPAPLEILWPVSPGYQVVFTSLSQWGQDSGWVSADPALGFETMLGNNGLPTAPTLQQIDSMATELAGYFALTNMAPTAIQGGGTDLVAALSPNWWAPDNYWSAQLGAPSDFFGTVLPIQVGGPFSMGASQYTGG
jgi:hypothetical protein